MEPFILFGILFALLLAGVPIALSLGISASVFMVFFTGTTPMTIAQKLFVSLNKFALMAIPLFVLMGNFMAQGGTAHRIIRFARALVGHLPGGLPMSAIFACVIFAAVSGSSPATVAAIGSIMIGAIQQDGYSERFSVGSIVSSGSLGILMPPSIILIVYGVTVDQSIGALFMAGILPAAFLGLMLMAVTYVAAVMGGHKRKPMAPLSEIWAAFKDAIWGLLVIIIVIGGIYGGLFTPTEAAAVAAVYAFITAKFIYGDLKWKDIPQTINTAAATAAMIMFIIANAMVFAHILTTQQMPQDLANFIVALDLNKYTFLILINLMLLLAGNFMEPSSLIMILAPLIFPIAMQLGIDPIHLGVIITVNMEIGMLTPPVGLNLFVASGISGLTLQQTIKASLPWFLALLCGLAIITYVPQISLFVPEMIYG